ncbi:bifunctional 4-hydroxy-3-methylbut-2-enyl diphosphate reductase/30S ribosomal protein S1 [Anaerosinus massiliensis]|uniref:bifunctional 4-hydroxy-3-methylbut-2-enyl diphosphate reductase/30S ribosomal protein S1 n=1 Tax=Massilibacillus massiliensis TaxID=1806837 RepID=UPI000A58AD55|nr:bifunctional 4-hydroxy-3-methylbut-2-enyl diphosphate reductase/30S ribosomal protein S1 [Massilibacillus massiliensis]
MKVILAEHYGFCYGVKRAVKMAQDSINLEGPSYTLGPIIHNPQMVERLAKEGVGMVNHLSEVDGGTIIIRSHGVGPEVYEQAKKANFNSVDATCPHVKKAQMAAHELSEDGYQVIIIGEKCHPEVKSIFEWSGKQALIIETEEEAKNLNFIDKLGIVAQTTFSGKAFKKIVDVLMDKSNDIKIERTICTATEQRQAAAIALANDVDVMLVIGGKNSANTTRLAELCTKTGTVTYHIETVKELKESWFVDVKRVGITAGASTPDWIIKEVYNKVNNMEDLLEIPMKEIKVNDLIQGKVVGIHKNEVFIDIGYKAEGIIPITELAYPVPESPNDIVAIGDLINVYVLALDGEDGLKLSKVRADKHTAWGKLEEGLMTKEPVKGVVTAAIKGGLSIEVLGIRGFVPASQFDIKFVESLEEYAGREFDFRIIELNKEKGKAIFSRRVILEEENLRKEQAFFNKLSVNQIIQGTVKRLTSYGAFVDIGGIDGLVHISELSWERVKEPSEVVQVGDKVSVMVTNFDEKTKRISLSLKDVYRDPWLDKVESLCENTLVDVTVVKIMSFGAFASLANGLEGLIHLSELSEKHLNKADEAVAVGDKLRVKILHIDRTHKKIGLSLLQAQQEVEHQEYQEYIEAQAETKSTLGDKFGHLFKNFAD